MSTRKIKEAKDLSSGELIYFKGHAKATYMSDGTTVEDAINNIEVDLSDYTTKEELSSKQDKLLSGTNIKTINGESIIGSGDITIESGTEQIQADWNETDTTSKSYIANKPNIRQDEVGTINIGSGTQYTILNGQTFINKLFSGGIFANDYVFKIFDINENELVTFNKNGDGTKFLAGDCTYKSISTAYPQVNHGTSDTTFALTPNTFHVWDNLTTLDLSFGEETEGIANEFLFQFTSGATATTLTLPDTIKWADDINILPMRTYQVSIINDFATVLQFPAPTITFTIDNVEFYGELGMDWITWINTEYNSMPDSIYVSSDGANVTVSNNTITYGLENVYFIAISDGTKVLITDIIIPNHNYIITTL